MHDRDQALKAARFHKLHKGPSTFILPNAWDAISARIFETSGFEAIGTTSAGIAASLGYPDGENIPLEKLIKTIESITRAVRVPVSADIEAGYGKTAEEVLETVKKVVAAGAIGINLEDGSGVPNSPLLDLQLQKEKIAAIRDLQFYGGVTVFINARTDVYWLNAGDPAERFKETIKRAKVYQEAGADCIFVPGLNDRKVIENLRQEIACPMNLLADPHLPPLTDLSTIGIERLSCGSGPFRAAATYLKSISDEIFHQRTFHKMANGVMSYGMVTELMQLKQ